MSYDDNNGSWEEGLLGLGILALLAVPFVGGYAIYRGVQANKKINCYSCEKIFRNKELKTLKIRWDSYKEYETVYEEVSVDDDDFIYIDDDDDSERNRNKVAREIVKEEIPGIKMLSDWPEECAVPNDFRKECDSYFEKKVCDECSKKILTDLITRSKSLAEHAKEELERSKICCPRCNGRFLQKQLAHPASTGLPWYWVFEKYGDTDICKSCREEVITSEREKYSCAKEKSEKIDAFPASYKGNMGVDQSTIKINVESGAYRDRDDALNELRLRAFLEGYNVVINFKWNRDTGTEDADSGYVESINYIRGTHKYSVWSVIGSFAKYKT